MKTDIENLREKGLKNINKVIEIIISSDLLFFLKKLELVKFRIKSEESLLNKSNKLKIDVDKVYDLIGFRFVVKSIEDCYNLLHIIENTQLKIIEIRDYIKNPKDLDEYRALHVHIQYENLPCEIQIMDLDMHKLDEKTHDDYKLGLLEKK